MALQDCQFDQWWRSECVLHMTKLGDVHVKSKYDFCTAPPLLDISVQIEQHTWRLSFMASNRRESRIIGLEYWPLRLHVDFGPSDTDENTGWQSVLGCMESLKNGEELCFLNSTIHDGRGSSGSYNACQSSDQATLSSTTPTVILCLLLAILFISLSIGSFIWWKRRHSKNLGRKRHLETCVPPLPNSKPYVDSSDQSRRSMVSVISKSRPMLNPITEEDVLALPADYPRVKNPLRWRESKLIQTSLPSLEAQILIVNDDQPGPSSSDTSDNGSNCTNTVSPITPQSNNDKEKLIYSSSSESSV